MGGICDKGIVKGMILNLARGTIKGVGHPLQIKVRTWHDSPAWVARLIGPDEHALGGVAVDFLYSDRDRISRRGTGYRCYVVHRYGVYAAASTRRAGRTFKVYFKYDQGGVEIIDGPEAQNKALAILASQNLEGVKP